MELEWVHQYRLVSCFGVRLRRCSEQVGSRSLPICDENVSKIVKWYDEIEGVYGGKVGALCSDIDYEEAALALRFARHLGPIHCTIYTNGIMTKQRPPNKTYVHHGVSALRMISTTPTNAAPREHRTRLFWNRELVRDVLTAFWGYEGRTQAVTDELWPGRRSMNRVCVVFIIIMPMRPTT